MEKAKFLFKVRFEDKVKSDEIVRIYRDGTLVPESERKIPKSNINSYQPPGFFMIGNMKVLGENIVMSLKSKEF